MDAVCMVLRLGCGGVCEKEMGRGVCGGDADDKVLMH